MAHAGSFRQLTAHFFERFFDKESLSPQGEPEAGVIQTLGMLAAPAGIVSILTMPLRFESWDLVAFRFLYICYSMIAIGVVMVFEWDALFLDRRDYQILTVLPLRVFTIFLAKMTALGFFLAMFLAAINFFGILFWPSVETRGGSLAIAGTHFAVTFAAGFFSAVAIAGLQGILVTVFRGAVYRKISICTQTALMAALIMFLFLSPLLASSLSELCRTHSPYLNRFPGFWFAGLYEQLRPAVPRAAAAGRVLSGLGTVALRAVWVALAVVAVTFLPGYSRHARRVMEAPEPSPRGPGPLARALNSALDRLLLHDSVQCGVFHFVGQTIARSLKHRLFLATYGGLGAALVVIMIASGGSSRRVPLILSFFLISGLRAAFNFPSELRANWAFQVSETHTIAAYVRATRAWMAVCAILPLFLLLAGIEAIHSPFVTVLFHFAFGVAASLVLMEALFLDFHKVPFTCSRFPGKVNLVLLSVLYVFGFTFYSSYMASLEDWLWATPAAAILFFLAIGSGLLALSGARRHILGSQVSLEYEDEDNPAVRTLRLSEQ